MIRISLLILPFSTLLTSQSLPLPFQEIEHRVVQRLGVSIPEARIRLSEPLYSDSTVMQLLPRVGEGDISPFLMYRLNVLRGKRPRDGG